MESMQRTEPPATEHRFGGLALRTAAVALAAIVSMPTAYAHGLTNPDNPACDAVGMWFEPATGKTLATDRFMAALARRPVVLLGELHDNAEHHRWQLHTLAALHGRNPDMVLGFESFPRRLQPNLDRWVNGELDAEAFLKAVDWPTIWGIDPALYLPLFHFVRQNRIPMIALNVDRTLVSRVSREGWAAIPAEERAGLSDPAPPGAAYRESLARTYLFKQSFGEQGRGETAAEEADTSSVIGTEAFARFVEAQLTWDRAMAEALATARQRRPTALVIGIIGSGHIQYRHGVPHQLADLGIVQAAVLLPVDHAEACDRLPADLADAVFIMEAAGQVVAAPPKARLGVMIETGDDGVRVTRVLEDSVAAVTGIAVDDIVVSAAGFPIAQAAELVEIVQRQAPGTWLPLTVRRGGEDVEIIARFPTVLEPAE
jgi:uncharacterized iron-regulated protein